MPQASEDITYAKNRDKFMQEPVYERPFSISNPTTAEEHFDVGVNCDNQKQFSKAAEEYEKALVLKPDWAVAHVRLARDYAAVGRTNDAIAHWTTAIQCNPQLFNAYEQLAAEYVKHGKVNEAIKTYTGLLKYSADEMSTRYQLAVWHAQLGQTQLARENFEKYLDLARKAGANEQSSERFQAAIRELSKFELAHTTHWKH